VNSIKKAAIAGVALAALGAGVAQAAPGRSASVNPFSGGGSSVTRTFDGSERGVVIKLDVTETGYAGFSLVGASGDALSSIPVPSFEFKADSAETQSGGSPRLVVRLSDGGRLEVRPLSWSTDWTTVDGTTVDGNGGCGFQYAATWAAAVACHPNTTVTSAYIVSDSGWLNGSYTNWIDDVQFDGVVYDAAANS
jgi:hypothetical protein